MVVRHESGPEIIAALPTIKVATECLTAIVGLIAGLINIINNHNSRKKKSEGAEEPGGRYSKAEKVNLEVRDATKSRILVVKSLPLRTGDMSPDDFLELLKHLPTD
jgi:hypothetical protein